MKIALHNGDLKGRWNIINTVLNKKSNTTQLAALDVEGSQICDSKRIIESMNFSVVLGIPSLVRYLKPLINF